MIGVSDVSRNIESTRMLHLSLERDPQAPSLARAAVAEFTRRRGAALAQLETLTLLVSELVSNAVIHSDAPGDSDVLLSARLLDGETIRVEVTDQGNGFAVRPREPGESSGGFGLYLVDRQSTRWGVEREGGTCVWFELALSASR